MSVYFNPCRNCGAENVDYGVMDKDRKHYVYTKCRNCGYEVTAELYDDEYIHRTPQAVERWAVERWNDGL